MIFIFPPAELFIKLVDQVFDSIRLVPSIFSVPVDTLFIIYGRELFLNVFFPIKFICPVPFIYISAVVQVVLSENSFSPSNVIFPFFAFIIEAPLKPLIIVFPFTSMIHVDL